MHKILKSIFALAVCVMLIAALPMQAFAAGKIIVGSNAALTLVFKDEDKVIPGSRFDVYRVAEVDEYSILSLTNDFLPYKDSVEGLSTLESLNHDSWLNLAATLKGIVQRDALTPVASGITDGEGTLVFPSLELGLYLVVGYRATTPADNYTYSPVPFMAFLPDYDKENNDWVYELSVCPKFTKKINPHDDPDDKVITRKVLKIWDDEGFESIRPENIEVKLMRDGQVYDTQLLSAGNSWRYSWDNLDPEFDWTIAETVPEYYVMSLSQEGITFTLKNKYVVPISGETPYAVKKLLGDRPSMQVFFTFELRPFSGVFPLPMPEGTNESGVKEVSVLGAGTANFGKITFKKPGTYIYTVSEKNLGLSGYTYDPKVYLLTYTVTQTDADLSVHLDIKDPAGNLYPSPVFTNVYRAWWLIPQTGALWWPVPVMLAIGIILLSFGAVMKRRSGKSGWILGIGLVFFLASAGLSGYNMYDNIRAGKAAGNALELVLKDIPEPEKAKTMSAVSSEENLSEQDLPEYPDYVLNPKMDLPLKKVAGNDYVGVIEIPAIDRKLAVINEWSYEKLEISPCRYGGTPYQGNMILCAHNYDTHFGPLKTLHYGDVVSFTDIDGNEFRYHVAEMEILQPDELDRLENSDWDLTLFTCTLGGNTRVVARCEKESV